MWVLPGNASEGQFCGFFWKMYIKCEVQKWQMWGLVYESILRTAIQLHRERFVFPSKCACNIMNYSRLDIWSIGQTLQKIQTSLFNIWTIWTGWCLLNFCQVRQCEFSPAMCMKCEAFYRKPHIVSKTHNVSSNGSTAADPWKSIHMSTSQFWFTKTFDLIMQFLNNFGSRMCAWL